MSTLVDIGYRPKDLVNPNTMTDYGKLKRLIDIFQLEDKLKGVLPVLFLHHGYAFCGYRLPEKVTDQRQPARLSAA